MLDVICVGEAVWDLHATKRLAALDALRAHPGGAAVNTAIALSSLGLAAGVCTAVGDDRIGAALRARVEAAGVDVRRMRPAPLRTGLVLAGADGVVAYRNAAAEIAALRSALPARWHARAVHVAALLPGRAAALLARVARAARRQGCLVTVDVNARPRLWAGAPGVPWSVLAAADVVKCSLDDLAAMGLPRRNAALALRARMRPSAVLLVTDGAREAHVLGAFGATRVAAPVARSIDPAGAGDAFCAAILADLLGSPAGARADRAGWAARVLRAHGFARRWCSRAARSRR